MGHPQWNVQMRTQLAAMGLKTISGRLQAMMHMQGHHLAGPLCSACQQQSRGICAATEPYT
jgi:hypothetical protein